MIRILIMTLALASAAIAEEQLLPERDAILSQLGVDLAHPPSDAVARAIIVTQDRNFLAQDAKGSAISLQIVRTFHPITREDARRPDKIAAVAEFEAAFDPVEVLTIYAHTVALGANCTGFDAAMRGRLGVAPEQASLRDALTLAALIGAPDRIAAAPALLTKRFDIAAKIGTEEGFWDEPHRQMLVSQGPTAFDPAATCR